MVESRFLRFSRPGLYLIIDYIFWLDNATEIEDWLKHNTAGGISTQQGMTMQFSNESEELMFLLKWDGQNRG